MFTVEVKFPTPVRHVETRGNKLPVDLAKLSPDTIAKLVDYGLQQKCADAASAAMTVAGEAHFGKARAEVATGDWNAWRVTPRAEEEIAEAARIMALKAIDALERGDWQVRVGTGTSTPTNPATKLAHDTAKAVLLAGFKRATGKVKLADIAKARASLAEFFVEKGDKTQWNEERVAEWIAAQAEAGKRDYMAEAEAALAGAQDAVGALADLGLE